MSGYEFDCVECGRHVVRYPVDLGNDQHLCGHCLTLPGWFRDAGLRKRIDPTHDGREVVERQPPVEAR